MIYEEIATSSYTLAGAVTLHKNPCYQDKTQIQLVSLANLTDRQPADTAINATAAVAETTYEDMDETIQSTRNVAVSAATTDITETYEEPMEEVNENIRNVPVVSHAAATDGDETAYEDMENASESAGTAGGSQGCYI